jgi:hypothetical protein
MRQSAALHTHQSIISHSFVQFTIAAFMHQDQSPTFSGASCGSAGGWAAHHRPAQIPLPVYAHGWSDELTSAGWSTSARWVVSCGPSRRGRPLGTRCTGSRSANRSAVRRCLPCGVRCQTCGATCCTTWAVRASSRDSGSVCSSLSCSVLDMYSKLIDLYSLNFNLSTTLHTSRKSIFRISIVRPSC